MRAWLTYFKYLSVVLVTIAVTVFTMSALTTPLLGAMIGAVVVWLLVPHVTDATCHDISVYEFGDDFISYNPDTNFVMVKDQGL